MILALDLSMSNTGYAIFSNDGCLEMIGSIETPKNEKDYGRKLKCIAKEFLKLKKKYKPNKVVIERGFSRFNRSTEVIYRVFGLAEYIFSSEEKIYIPSLSVRKIVLGQGNAKKEEVAQEIKWRYQSFDFNNYDETDATATGLAYFMREGKQ